MLKRVLLRGSDATQFNFGSGCQAAHLTIFISVGARIACATVFATIVMLGCIITRSGRTQNVHRTIEITVSAAATQQLSQELEQMEHVTGLSIQRGVSVKPPGDVIVVHMLNRGADAVLARANAAQQHDTVSIVTSEIASIIDPEHDRSQVDVILTNVYFSIS